MQKQSKDVRHSPPRNWADEKILDLPGQKFTLKPVSISDVSPDKIYTWKYKAQYSGTKGKGLAIGDGYYDAMPLCVILSATRSGILGLNTNYLEMAKHKTKFIWRFRRESGYDNSMIKLMIHKYKIENIKSQIYEVNNMISDAEVLRRSAEWVKVDR